MGDLVKIVSRRMVRPEPAATSGPPETIHLTPWDLKQLTGEHIQKGVLLPSPPTTGAAAAADVERLASSFARALARFYPFAGRLVATPAAGREGLDVSLRCGGVGAEFVHAVAPGVTVADVAGPLRIPRLVWSFFPLDRLLGVDAIAGSLPLLAAQVTVLADGVFVAMSLNHAVADGTTFWQLFNTWSEISRRGVGGDEVSSPLPMHRRLFLDGCPVPIPLPFGSVEDIVGQRLDPWPPVEECFFHFSAESIKELKGRANAEMSGSIITTNTTISSLQAILAHVWRAVCRARRLAPDEETMYTLLLGCRGRVDGVPTAYAGNAVEHAAAKSPAGDILDKGLGWAAWLLNRAVTSFDVASARDKLASWPGEPSFACMPAISAAAHRNLVTGSSPRFDVYGNDFGWGRPVTVRSGAGNKLEGKVTVYEGRAGAGTMALEVCLAPEELARLVADEEFMGATVPSLSE